MSERRARNAISRDKEMSLRAADLLDDGLTDPQVYKILKSEFPKKKFSSRTVSSFRKRDYEPIAQERLTRQENARKVELIMSAAQGDAGTYAEAGQAILAKLMYDAIRSDAGELEPKHLAAMGKTLAKIRELDIAEMKVQIQREKEQQAEAIKKVAGNKQMSSDELVHEVDKIMGLAR